MEGAVLLLSKIERWQKRCKVNGTMMSAKNMPPSLCYKGQQWGAGGSNSSDRGKSGYTRRGRFNGQTGPKPR